MSSEISVSGTDVSSAVFKSIEEQLQELHSPTPSQGVTIKSERPATPLAEIPNLNQQKENSSKNAATTIRVTKDTQLENLSTCAIKKEPRQDLPPSSEDAARESIHTNESDQPIAELEYQNQETNSPVSKKNAHGLSSSKLSSAQIDTTIATTDNVSGTMASKIKVEFQEAMADHIPRKSQENRSKKIDELSKAASSNGERNKSDLPIEAEKSRGSTMNVPLEAKTVTVKSELCPEHKKETSKQQSLNEVESTEHSNISAISEALIGELSKAASDLNGSKENAVPANKKTNSSEKVFSSNEKLSDSKSINTEHNFEQAPLCINDNEGKTCSTATNVSTTTETVEIKSEVCLTDLKETSKQQSSNNEEPTKRANICVIREPQVGELSETVSFPTVSKENALAASKQMNSPERTLPNKEWLSDSKSIQSAQNARPTPITTSSQMVDADKIILSEENLKNNEKVTIVDSVDASKARCIEDNLKSQLPLEIKTAGIKVGTTDLNSKERFDDVLKDLGADFELKSNDEKMEELRKYIPFLERWVKKLKATNSNQINNQLMKIETLLAVLANRRKSHDAASIAKFKAAIINLQKAACSNVQIPKPKSIKTEKIDVGYESTKGSNVCKAEDTTHAIQTSIQTISLDSDDSDDDITFHTVASEPNKNHNISSTTEKVKKEHIPMEVDGVIHLSDDESEDVGAGSSIKEEDNINNIDISKGKHTDVLPKSSNLIIKENASASADVNESSCKDVTDFKASDKVNFPVTDNSDDRNNCVEQLNSPPENPTLIDAEVEKERIITQLQQKILSLTSNVQPKVPEAGGEITPIVKTEIAWPSSSDKNMPLCIDLLDSDDDDAGSKSNESCQQKTIDLEKLAEKPAEELIPIWLKMAQECGIKPSIATDLWGGNACINLADDDDCKASESSQSDAHFDDPVPNDHLIDDLPSQPASEEMQYESRKSVSPSFSPPPQALPSSNTTFEGTAPPSNQNTPMVTFPQDPRSSYNTKPISSYNNSRRSMPMVSVPKTSDNPVGAITSFNSVPFSYDTQNLNLTNNVAPKDPRLNAENSRCYGTNLPAVQIKPPSSSDFLPNPAIPMQPAHSTPMQAVSAMPMQSISSMSMQPVHRMPIQPVQPMPIQQNPFDQLRMNTTPTYNPPQRNPGYNNYNNNSFQTANHFNRTNYKPNPFKTQPHKNTQNYNNYSGNRTGSSYSLDKTRMGVSYTAAPYNYGAREEKKDHTDIIKPPSTPTTPTHDSIIDKAYRSNDYDTAIKAPVGFKIPKKSFSGFEDVSTAARIRNEFNATEYIKLGRGKNEKKGKFTDPNDTNQEISPECEMVPSIEPIHDVKKKKEKKIKKKPQKKGSKNSMESKKITCAKRKLESDPESSSDEYNFSMDKTFAQASSSSDSSDEVEKSAPKKGRKPKSKQNSSFEEIFSDSAMIPRLQLFYVFNKLISTDKMEHIQKFLKAVKSIDTEEESSKKRKKGKPAQTKTETSVKKVLSGHKELDKSYKHMDARSSSDILNTGVEIDHNTIDEFSGEVNMPSEPIYFRQIAKKRWKRMKTNDSVVGYNYTPKLVDDDSDFTDYYYDFPSKRVTIQKRVKAQFRYSLEPVLCLSRCDGVRDPTPLLVPMKEIPFNDDAKRNKKKSWMKNTDRSRHCRSSYVEKCVVCKKPKDDIVSHYVNQHKNTEVFISRLSQKDLNDIAKHPNHFNLARSYEAKCVFCREIQSFNLKFWHQHLSEHTGEYAYQCNACDLLAPKKPPLIYHTKNECDADARVHKIYHFDVQSGKISLYACVHCNYVQLYKENIMQHLKTEHEHSKPAETDCREIEVFKITNPNNSTIPAHVNENIGMDIDEESMASVRDILDDGGEVSTSDFDEANESVQVKVEVCSERTDNATEPSSTIGIEPQSAPEVAEEITTEDAVVVKQEPSEITNSQPTVIKIENAMEIDEECSMRNSIVFGENTASQDDSEQLYQPTETSQAQAVPVAISRAGERSFRNYNTIESNSSDKGNEAEPLDVKPFTTNSNTLPSMEMCLKPWAMHSYNTVYKKDKNLCKELEKSSNICALYKCSKKDCIFTTDSDVLFRDHISTHGYIFLECPYCDTKVPTNIAELIVHIEDHKTDFFQCSNCFYRSCSAYNVYLHQNMYHFQDADRKIYICLAHSTYSTGSLGMTRADCISRIEDILTNRATNVPPAKCRLCSQNYFLKSTLLSHAKAAHKIDVTDEIFNSVGVFVCLYCGYETDYIWNIRRHLMQHHPQKLTIVTARLQNACPQLKGVVQQNVLSSTMLINVSEGVAEKLISLPPKTTFVDPDYEKMEKNLRLAINSLDIRKNYKLSKLFAENYSECFMNFDGTDVGLKDNLTVYKRSLGEDTKVKNQKNFADLYLFINPILATRGYESADLYYCCDTPHASAETYFTHLQTKAHNKGLMIKCNQCNGCYDIAFLRNHILFHRKPRYICFACGFVCATADGIQTHFTTIHRKIKGKLRCIIISVLHVYEAFLNDEDENDNEYYYVVNCESTKLSRPKFTEYIVELFERHHEGSLLSNPLTGTMITVFPNSVKIPEFVSHEIRYACSICGLSQNNFDELETHLRQEHLALTENYSCHHCKTKLPMYDSCYYRIKRHIELHGISVFQCNVCLYFHYDREIMLHHCKYFHTSNNIAIFSHVRRGKDSAKEEFEIVQNNLLGVTNNSSLRQNFDCPICKEFNVEDLISFSGHLKNRHNSGLVYKCGYCETKGSEQNTINNHLKSKHPSKSRDVRVLFNSPAQASGSGITVQDNPQKKSKSGGKLRLVSLDKLK